LLERNAFEPRLGRAKGRLEKVEAEATALATAASEEQQVEAVLGQLQEFTRRVGEGLEEASWQSRREIIRALVKRVEIDTAEVRVIYKVPPHPFVEAPFGGCLQDRLGRERTPLGCPLLGRTDQPVFHHPRLEEGADEFAHALIGYALGDPCHQPVLVDPVEEFSRSRSTTQW
jgi:site-specific DNA recombinase